MIPTMKNVALFLAIGLALLGPASWAGANPEIYAKVLPSTGLILVPQGNNKDMIGTCWVVDQEQKLVVTNNHVVTDKDEAVVYFPKFNNGEVNPLRDFTLKSGERIAGKVIHRDVNRDLALVRLEKLPITARALKFSVKSPRPGETIHSIGNSGYNNGILWRYTQSQVRIVAPYRIKIDAGMINAVVIETQGPINQGDSGGPLVNDRGELVGVVSAFHIQDRLITWNIDARELRVFLKNAPPANDASVVSAR